jgi:hypothetical protein
MENQSSTPGRKIVELSRRLPAVSLPYYLTWVTETVSYEFTLVGMSHQPFIYFYKLLQTILSTQFDMQFYRELIICEENVSQQLVKKSSQDTLSQLKIHLYLWNLPDYYCALTLYDGLIVLRSKLYI